MKSDGVFRTTGDFLLRSVSFHKEPSGQGGASQRGGLGWGRGYLPCLPGASEYLARRSAPSQSSPASGPLPLAPSPKEPGLPPHPHGLPLHPHHPHSAISPCVSVETRVLALSTLTMAGQRSAPSSGCISFPAISTARTWETVCLLEYRHPESAQASEY